MTTKTKRVAKSAPGWQVAASATLGKLSDLLVAAYDVLEHTTEQDSVIQPMEEAAGAVAEMRERDGKFTADEFGALLNTVHLRVEAAIANADSLQIVAWRAIASEILREAAAPQSATERFLRGRDLAISMLCTGDSLQGTDESEALRRYRNGKAQNRFARVTLGALIADPTMLEGFAAVLSARLAAQDVQRAEAFDLPMEEFEAGEVGADGTKTYDDDAQPAEPTAPPEAVAAVAKCIAGADADAEQRAALAAEWQDEGRRTLTRRSLVEIDRLTEAVPAVLDANFSGAEDAVASIMARIRILSDVAYHASGFSADDDAPAYTDLCRAFEGSLR